MSKVYNLFLVALFIVFGVLVLLTYGYDAPPVVIGGFLGLALGLGLVGGVLALLIRWQQRPPPSP